MLPPDKTNHFHRMPGIYEDGGGLIVGPGKTPGDDANWVEGCGCKHCTEACEHWIVDSE